DALVQLEPSPPLGKPEMFRLPAALDLSQIRLSLHPLIRQGLSNPGGGADIPRGQKTLFETSPLLLERSGVLSPLLEQRRELDVPSLLLHRPQIGRASCRGRAQ